MTVKYILGIESTAHTFGVAVLKEKKILSNVKDLFTTKEGGMIPVEVTQHHVDVCDEVVKLALQKAKVKLSNIELISYSQSPGMGHCLRIGAMVARSLSAQNNIPLIGVNHCIAHLEIGRMLTGAKDPVMLYASGANTQVIAFESGKYRIFGETLDIGIGNFLDQFARELGLGFPGGPKIYDASLRGKTFIPLPYVVKGMDVSYSGILTNLKQKLSKGMNPDDLCYSAQETAFAMLLEVSERAMSYTEKKELLLAGGVACNKRLQEMASIMCKERGAKLFVPKNEFLVDNAAMIAWLGFLEFSSGKRMELHNAGINPHLRTDEIEVTWR